MVLHIAIRIKRGAAGDGHHLAGWEEDSPGTVTLPTEIALLDGTGPGSPLLRLSLDPGLPAVTAAAAGGTLHYFRCADATVRPLPPTPPPLPFARGDAYIAVSRSAVRLAATAIARFIHVRDDFNADGLARGLLELLPEQTGRAGFPADVTVLVVEAR